MESNINKESNGVPDQIKKVMTSVWTGLMILALLGGFFGGFFALRGDVRNLQQRVEVIEEDYVSCVEHDILKEKINSYKGDSEAIARLDERMKNVQRTLNRMVDVLEKKNFIQ